MDVDDERAERAVHELLAALGIDLTTESLERTPARVAKMYREFLTPTRFHVTTFPNDERVDELVIVRGHLLLRRSASTT